MPERMLRAIFSDENTTLLVCLAAFFGSSFSGLATHLRSGSPLTTRMVLAAVLNSGLVGLIVALMGYKTFQDNLTYLLGLSLLAGIGGATLLDFMVALLKRRMGILSGDTDK